MPKDQMDMPAISRQIWDMKYRLKTLEGEPIDDSPDATWERVSRSLAEAEKPEDRESWTETFLDVTKQGHFSPAGRIIAGAGSGRNVTLSNCFTMGTIVDSMDGIFSALREAALTMQAGGGIGYDFSTIRPKGAPVKGVGADASGPLSFMDCWDAMCRTVMSAGSRRGAMMATMRCTHPDIIDFVTAKSDPTRLRMFNLSVLVTDEFMDAVRTNGDWRLHFEDRHGVTISEKTIRARDLWDKIMESTYAFAEPGVIFIDRVNEDHNLGYLETIATTNPCGEKPMGPYASCLLGSINVAKLIVSAFNKDARIDTHKLKLAVRVAIRMMDNVIDVGRFPLPEQKQKAKDDRQLGLGITGLADALIMLGITYGSDEAVNWTTGLMRAITLAAYDTSIRLAEEKGAFPTFDAEKFLNPKSFAGRMLPKDMQDRIREHGIRNGLLISIAPTGTISLYAGNVSSGIEPVFAAAYDRKVLQPDGTKTTERVVDYAVAAWEQYVEDDALPAADLPPAYVDAQSLTPEAHVKMQAAAQDWVDSSISKTVNLPKDISFDDFKAVYHLAYESGCKGCTTYRPNEVTGSILSVEAAPPPTTETAPSDEFLFLSSLNGPVELNESSRADLVKVASDWLKHEDPKVRKTRMNDCVTLLEELGVSKVAEVQTQEQFDRLVALISGEGVAAASDPKNDFQTAPMGFFQTVQKKPAEPENPHHAQPQKRPEDLPGKTYKLRWPDHEHAIYITINDVEENGQRRPFEIFINSKNMDHYAWTVAMTRMVSAVFRRPHNSFFVVEELKAVFDPKGGSWMGGKFVPSIIAAIGGVIERHMASIGYIDHNGAQDTLTKLPPVTLQGPPGKPCPKCHSYNTKNESGCLTCLDCFNSKCG